MKKAIVSWSGPLIIVGFFILWMLVHIPGISYGSYQIPLHQSYVGDEQSAVNGALHMLQTHSLFGLRNITTLYYGPVFAAIDVPAVVMDFVSKWARGLIHSAADYQNYILYDWGGIVWWLHATAALSTFLGLWAAYLLMRTRTMNPSGRRSLPYLAAALLGGNFYYFEYSNFAKHWAFIIPLVIVQLYCLVRITETDGREHRFWIVHAIATILVFGISYGGVIFLVMWVPWLVDVIRRKDWMLLRRFLAYAGLIAVGWAVMVAWDPYPFGRSLGFLGLGDTSRGVMYVPGTNLITGTSFGWYAAQIILNDLALVLAGIIMAIVLWRGKAGKPLWRSSALWTLILPAIMGYLFFGIDAHHEGRYMLPTVVFLVLAVGYLWSLYVREFWKKKNGMPAQAEQTGEVGARFTAVPTGRAVLRTSLATLLVCYGVFQIAADVQWMRIYARGPLEKTGIAEVLSLQKSDGPVLVIQGYLLGQVHGKASYAAWIGKNSHYETTNLYQALLAGTPPSNIPELNVRYDYPQDFQADPGVIRDYPHAVWEYTPIPDQINQFDYFDRDLARLWYYDDLSPRWIILN